MKDIHKAKILILDFGSQYTQLIARRVREIGVYCEIYPYDVAFSRIQSFAANGIIFSGGPDSVNQDNAPMVDEAVFSLNIPILGICYGMQLMAKHFGGKVVSGHAGEYGHAKLIQKAANPLWPDEIHQSDVWMSHGDKVTQLPEHFEIIASSNGIDIAAMSSEKHQCFGIQFHPEVTHSEKGDLILKNFVLEICQCEALWQTQWIAEELIAELKENLKDDKVILGLSGGVDSSVVALLLDKAIGKNLTCIFVDTGLLRQNEATEVMQLFNDNYHLNVIKVDANKLFLENLKGISCPEEKRKTIGRVFIEVFEEKANQLNGIKWLAQGTIYPDVIESSKASDSSQVIKSHHNVGGLPERLNFKLVEPLRGLFKDEVRALGAYLGLEKTLLNRHPFPGPGLGVRILGEIKKDYIEILQKADAIFIKALMDNDLYYQVSQAFAVFLPVKSVGVVGDGRRYDYVIALRAVKTIDFMTATWAELPHAFLAEVSTKMINEIAGISRVVYDISGKPPATIEWE